jgi:alginate O-acetyltransferase complex protein AlgI
VMLLGGLWHGASWTFVIWGGIHGVWLIFERVMGKASVYRRLPSAIQIAMTFFIVLIAWVFFRTDRLEDALSHLGAMFGNATSLSGGDILSVTVLNSYFLLTVLASGIVIWVMPQTWDWTRRLTPMKAFIALACMALSVIVLESQAYNPFIYFIF